MLPRTDYLLGMDRHMFQNVSVHYAHHNLEYYLVLVFLCGAPAADHLRYFGKKIRPPPPLQLLAVPGGVDRLFADIWGAAPKMPRMERPRQSWIFTETWCLINIRISERWHKGGELTSVSTLNQQIKSRLQDDCFHWAEEAGDAFKSLIVSNLPLFKEAWIHMWRWYKYAVDPPPPVIFTIEHMAT